MSNKTTNSKNIEPLDISPIPFFTDEKTGMTYNKLKTAETVCKQQINNGLAKLKKIQIWDTMASSLNARDYKQICKASDNVTFEQLKEIVDSIVSHTCAKDYFVAIYKTISALITNVNDMSVERYSDIMGDMTISRVSRTVNNLWQNTNDDWLRGDFDTNCASQNANSASISLGLMWNNHQATLPDKLAEADKYLETPIPQQFITNDAQAIYEHRVNKDTYQAVSDAIQYISDMYMNATQASETFMSDARQTQIAAESASSDNLAAVRAEMSIWKAKTIAALKDANIRIPDAYANLIKSVL